MKACQYFLKVLAVFSTMALLYVPMKTTEWPLASACGEMWSLEKAPRWRDKTEADFMWSSWPILGHHHGMGIGRAPAWCSLHPVLGSQHLLGAHCPCSLAKQPAQHCAVPLNNYFPTGNALGALPKLSYTEWLKTLPTFYPIAYAVALPLSLKGHTSFCRKKNDLLF